ncbi:MAG: patatin-like phospholipase family protein [Candidatus Nanopelagicales bacterium]|nr:patatin-like phospholipase family protein [Candidatus Nanopelagicales bacterium]
MNAPVLKVPQARDEAVREAGPLLPLAHRLPAPIHFALAGGGSHGAIQWGLLQALEETDIRPAALIGTSVGALTGAVVAEDPASAVNRLTYIWTQLELKFLVGGLGLTKQLLLNALQPGLVDNDNERGSLEAMLRARDFADLAVPFAAVTTDLASGRATVIDSGPLIPALLASSAIPGVLPPVSIDGRWYVDGLASANLPAVQAVQRGAGSVVVLDTGSRDAQEVSTSATRIVARLSIALAASQRRAQLAEAGEQVPVVLLPTPNDLGGTLDFGETVSNAAQAYSMCRDFLGRLTLAGSDHLTPGVYADASFPGLGQADAHLVRTVGP